ncbi:MAG TPA: hypothetical protein VE131_10545 [Terriglobales bacterium]|nr:hypothetical protein [Terriglobales bacterium]
MAKIFLTSGLTIIGGVLVYVLGQIFIRFFVDPYQRYRQVVGEIADALDYYANVSGGSHRQRQDEASNAFRQRARLLRMRAYEIPYYNRFARWRWVPPWQSVMEASSALMSLSNDVYGRDHEAIGRRRDAIITNLKLPRLK